MTYNIHKGFGVGNIRFLLHQIREALEHANPDLLFIQEIQGEHTKHEARIESWPQTTQFEFLAENLWPYFAYGKNALYKSGHHGNAILSKIPFIEWENIDVAKHKRTSRSMLHGVLTTNGGVLHVICIHFALFKTQREKQLSLLKERIIQHVPINEPLIVAGDFNDWRGEAEKYLETELKLKEAFKVCQGSHAKTFPAWKPKLPIDRIYFRNIDLIACERMFKMPWRTLSDHVPLSAEFKI